MKNNKTKRQMGTIQSLLAPVIGIVFYFNSLGALAMDDFTKNSLNQKRGELNFKLLISSQLSPHLLSVIFNQEGPSYQEIVIQGVNPDQTLQEALLFWHSQLAGLKHIPRISIDPRIFREHEITRVPTLLALVNEQVIAKVTGIISVDWLIERLQVDYDLHSNHNKKTEITFNEDYFNGSIKDYGVQGALVNISERDLLALIEEKIKQINWVELKDKSIGLFWRTFPFRQLSKADKCQIRQLSGEMTLTQPLLNEKGDVLVPIGTRFDPFDYLPFLQTVIVFNGNDPEEIDSIIDFIQNPPFERHTLTLIVTELAKKDPQAHLSDLQQRFKSPIYVLNRMIEERFQIKYTPTVIKGNKNMFEIYSGCLTQS